MDRASQSNEQLVRRILFCPAQVSCAPLAGDVARRLMSRGIACRFVARDTRIADSLRPIWGPLVESPPLHLTDDAGRHTQPGIIRLDDYRTVDHARALPAGAPPPRLQTSNVGAPDPFTRIGGFDAWCKDWTEPRRRRLADAALSYWREVDWSDAALLVVADRPDWFADAAAAAARRAGRPVWSLSRSRPLSGWTAHWFCEQSAYPATDFGRPPPPDGRTASTSDAGFLVRQPASACISQHGAGPPRPALWPAEQRDLDLMRSRLSTGFRPLARPRDYAVFIWQASSDPALWCGCPYFVNQGAALAAVIGALPTDLHLLILAADGIDVDPNDRRAIGDLLRPGDSWVEADGPDASAVLAGARVAAAVSAASALEALWWDRPLVLLGDPPFRGLGLTLDYVDGAALIDLISRAIRTPPSIEAVGRQDAYLHHVFCVRAILAADNGAHHRSDIDPSRAWPGSPVAPAIAGGTGGPAEAIADRIAACLFDGRSGTDWPRRLARMADDRNALQQALRAFADRQSLPDPLVVTSAEFADDFEALAEPHRVIAPDEVDDVPADLLAHAVLVLFLPDAEPAELCALTQRLYARGVNRIVDLAAEISRPGSHAAATPVAASDLHRSVTTPSPGAAQSNESALLRQELQRIKPRSVLTCGPSAVAAAVRLHAMAPSAAWVAAVDGCQGRHDHRHSRFAPELQVVPVDSAGGFPFDSGSFDAVVVTSGSADDRDLIRAELAAEATRVASRGLLLLDPQDRRIEPADWAAVHDAVWRGFGPVWCTSAPPESGSGLPPAAAFRLDHPLITIFAFPAIDEPPFDCGPDERRRRFLRPERFEAIIDDLLHRGWRLPALSEAMEWARTGQVVPRRTGVLSFLDGYRSVYEQALPMLAARGVRAAVFPVSSAINGRFNGRRSGGTELTMLTAAQLRDLRDAGWDVGSHSVTHTSFAHQSPQQVRDELIESRRDLEDLLGSPVRLFALPDSTAGVMFHPQHVEQARAESYELVLTAERGFVNCSANDFAWPTIPVAGRIGPHALQRRLAELHAHLALGLGAHFGEETSASFIAMAAPSTHDTTTEDDSFTLRLSAQTTAASADTAPTSRPARTASA